MASSSDVIVVVMEFEYLLFGSMFILVVMEFEYLQLLTKVHQTQINLEFLDGVILRVAVNLVACRCRDDTDDPKQSTADMTAFVQNLLQQMQSRFQTMSDSIITKNILIMGSRIDELEQSINDLRTEMGVEGSLSPSASLKQKIEPKSADDSGKE
ncbi:hypothetical protein EV1_012338 [Malus domestica]